MSRATVHTVLVTDGDERPALAITRSLGRRGCRVLVGAEAPVSLASSSRHCAGAIAYPSPRRSPDAFQRFLRDFVATHQIDAVLPVTDITTQMVAADRDELERHTVVAAPPIHAFDEVADKAALMRRAAACGIAIPRTLFVDGQVSLQRALRSVEYPAVVKPARSRVRSGASWLSTSVAYAYSESDLGHLYNTREYLARYPSLIQERIVGPGTGLFVLCDRGRVVASFAHRRLREKPPSGGVSVLSESIAADPALVAQATRLLSPLQWHGVAMLEYKQDRRSGTPYLMEVNGRFWGSLQLAIDAGVDFPYLWVQLALGGAPQVPSSYTVGAKSRWLLGDVDHLLIRLRHDNRDIPADAPSRLRAVAQFVKPTAHLRHEIFRCSDPRPAWHELREYVRSLRVPARARRQLARMCAAVRLRPVVATHHS